MGYTKMNKRHAQENMMKKNLTHEGPSIRKKGVGHMKVQLFQNRENAHVQRMKIERDGS